MEKIKGVFDLKAEPTDLEVCLGIDHIVKRQGDVLKEWEDQGTGEGIEKYRTCFDCGQVFHVAVQLALGWACWKSYLGRSESDGHRRNAM